MTVEQRELYLYTMNLYEDVLRDGGNERDIQIAVLEARDGYIIEHCSAGIDAEDIFSDRDCSIVAFEMISEILYNH